MASKRQLHWHILVIFKVKGIGQRRYNGAETVDVNSNMVVVDVFELHIKGSIELNSKEMISRITIVSRIGES